MNGRHGAVAALALLLAGCASNPTAYDYAAFLANPPRSILVLPPLNESPAVEATYGYLSSVTRPLAEHGYYVFPVQVIDAMLKDNGLPTAGEMHDVPLRSLREVTGADAVLYVTVEQYGSSYRVVSSHTTVSVRARLVATEDGTLLWEGRASESRRTGTGLSGDLLGDMLVAAFMQALNTTSDEASRLARVTSQQLVSRKSAGLPYGPYHHAAGTVP